MRIKAISLAATALVLSTNVNAAVLTFDNGKVSGVTGIESLGSTWDVTFRDGSFSSLSPLYDITMTNQNDADTASRDLLAFLETTIYAKTPDAYLGCTAISPCSISTVFETDGSVAKVVFAGIRNAENNNTIGTTNFDVSDDFTFATYASWSVSTVPIPAAIWLFGSGLIGLIGVAKRKKA